MITNLVRKIVGSRNDRTIKRMAKSIKAVNALEDGIRVLDDETLAAKTPQLRDRLKAGEELDKLLPEAFAVVREVSRRALDMRHFDVQLIGGMVLHEGKIAEMRTGEGKTLVATLPAYLNALGGKSVHVVTVNDYLARRDAEWMGEVFTFLGMTTGVVVPGMSPDEKRAAYACDVVYGTNNEYGFDYLRDNMAFSIEEKMQKDLAFGIVDEVDSILIDEARTPLIISGPTGENSDLYVTINRLIPNLERQERVPGPEDEEEIPGDYSVDEKTKQVLLSEGGHRQVEAMLVKEGMLAEDESLYDPANIVMMHHVNAALRAHVMFHRNVDYIVKDGEIVIVDEFTGRTMPGRRWSEGLHQAVEAKEGVAIQNENQTLASITFQNYFRLYGKLSGMTGTADTEASEFQEIYDLEVVVVPTHLTMIRDDRADLVYLTKAEKFQAIIEDAKDCIERGQPVLVGTTSIETSEYLSGLLTKDKVPHQVLNAKQHAKEADVVAHAGKPGTVTIATNMAGRGTDIVLGGNLKAELTAVEEGDETAIRADWQARHAEVIAAGGLHIIGTERHESRRVDNQLRGRAGRQGDVGSSRFYLSLEDDLMRIFASERVARMMKGLGMQEGEAIEHRWVTKAIENAQKKVEGRNFDIRKQLLEFDNVANDQRKEVYSLRNDLMSTEDVSDMVEAMRSDVLTGVIDLYIPPQSLDEQWDVPGLEKALDDEFLAALPLRQWLQKDEELHEETLRERIAATLGEQYGEKVTAVGESVMRAVEKAVMLQVLDQTWKEHLAAMDYLRQGIHLRGYAQKNPKQEYKREAFEMFQGLLSRFKTEVIGILSKGQIRADQGSDAYQPQAPTAADMNYEHADMDLMGTAESGAGAEEAPALGQGADAGKPKRAAPAPFVRPGRKIGRNEPCPCGSGRKYKQCHGRVQ